MLIFLIAVIAAVLLFGRAATWALLIWGAIISAAGFGLLLIVALLA